ncbi:hypothetical protein [Lysobacter arvi]|uniref:Guanylate cyclase domain-containing protein n=1 Tax=Lysobacter arvi TaxID=3038776 RepID=A0ABU1C8M4_9GAMM|nr:hypothetical protein [Lysobacter arvi]MDR0181536.1 hypothetical protein [Lysobacter arvi]
MTSAVFEQSYVAFLDVLGFSEMVDRAVSQPEADELNRLYRCHIAARNLAAADRELSIIQFSDSVVISRPYDPSQFSSFIKMVADYQRLLLSERILCRGGVSRGPHYAKEAFVMSAGLIDAYLLESRRARYPRVIVSEDLLKLVGSKFIRKSPLLQEDDGVVFVDFLRGGRSREKQRLADAARQCITTCREHASSSVLEKGVWLAAYTDAALGTTLSLERFGSPDWASFDI